MLNDNLIGLSVRKELTYSTKPIYTAFRKSLNNNYLLNMRNFFRLNILLIIVFLCTSCATYISYMMPTPPEIEISDEQNGIGFINKYDYTKLPFNNENKKEVNITAVQQLISSLETSFIDDESFNYVLLDSLAEGTATINFLPVMNANKVVSVCDSANTDLLLVLDFFDTDFLIKTEVEENDDGSKSRTNIVDLVVMAGLTLYNKSGTVLNRRKSSRSVYYQSRPALVSFVAIGPSMGKAGKEVNSLAKRIGENYIQNFYPGSQMETDKIYTGDAFEEVEPYMKNQEWEKAIELLLPLANSKDSKISKKSKPQPVCRF